MAKTYYSTNELKYKKRSLIVLGYTEKETEHLYNGNNKAKNKNATTEYIICAKFMGGSTSHVYYKDVVVLSKKYINGKIAITPYAMESSNVMFGDAFMWHRKPLKEEIKIYNKFFGM